MAGTIRTHGATVAATLLVNDLSRVERAFKGQRHAVYGHFRPLSLAFAEVEGIGEQGSGWLSRAVFVPVAVDLRSPEPHPIRSA